MICHFQALTIPLAIKLHRLQSLFSRFFSSIRLNVVDGLHLKMCFKRLCIMLFNCELHVIHSGNLSMWGHETFKWRFHLLDVKVFIHKFKMQCKVVGYISDSFCWKKSVAAFESFFMHTMCIAIIWKIYENCEEKKCGKNYEENCKGKNFQKNTKFRKFHSMFKSWWNSISFISSQLGNIKIIATNVS